MCRQPGTLLLTNGLICRGTQAPWGASLGDGDGVSLRPWIASGRPARGHPRGPFGLAITDQPGSRSRLAAVCRPPASGPHRASAVAPRSAGGRGGRRPRAWPEPTRGAERGLDEGPPSRCPRSDFLPWDASSKRKRQTELHARLLLKSVFYLEPRPGSLVLRLL